MRILVILILLSVPFSVSATETPTRWFSEFGVGIEMGVSLLEEAPGLDYDPGFAVGPGLFVGILRHGMHRAAVNLGYLYYAEERIGGTEQFEAITAYQRLTMAGGYDFCYKLLVVGAQIGTAMMVIDATRVLLANGPQGGRVEDVAQLGTVLASTDVVAVDTVAATLFDKSTEDLPYLRLAHESGLGVADISHIQLQIAGA